MPPVGSFVPHPKSLPEFRPEPEPGTSSLGRGASTSSNRALSVSIVPGGGDGFSLPSPSATFRKQPLASPFSTIQVEGESHVARQVKDPRSTLPQLAYATDPDTGAPLPDARYVQRNDQGQWVPAKAPLATASVNDVTPVKLANDPANYVIKDDSNTRTPQPLYLQRPNGNLIQTGKDGTYDGRGGVRPDNRLPGGVDPSKEVRVHRIHSGRTRLADAWWQVEEAQMRVADAEQQKADAYGERANALYELTQAHNAFVLAQRRYELTLPVAQDPRSALAPQAAHDLLQLGKMQADAAHRMDLADVWVNAAQAGCDNAEAILVDAQADLEFARKEVDDALGELKEAEKSSYG